MVRDLNGQIAPETLKSLANWQWPSNAIQLQEIDFNYKKEQGFDQVDGEYNGQAANSCISLRSAPTNADSIVSGSFVAGAK
jgi:hypothetical protein